MKTKRFSLKKLRVTCLILFCLSALHSAMADEGNISPGDKYGWSESTGWVNFRPTHGGVTVHDTFLSGYAWSGNIGWIKLGNGNAGPYLNSDARNWGVNKDSSGNLSGCAWSEAAGWINFDPSHSRVTIDSEGSFDGYAWSQNAGWIHFGNRASAYSVRKINIQPTLISSKPQMTELTDDDADNEGVLIADIAGDRISDVGEGALKGIAIYAADSGAGKWQYSSDGGSAWIALGSVSESQSLLLGVNDRIRFVPDGIGADKASFSFYAWDQTSGSRGAKADTTARGETSPFSAAGDTASVTVRLVIDVSGQVRYFGNSEPVSEVLFTLESGGGEAYTAVTDENGYFMFSGIAPGDYQLVPSKSGNAGKNSLTATDASKIARYVVEDYNFNEYQKIAADVNENSRITGLDASDLARFSVGVIPEMNERANHWAFVPKILVCSELKSDLEDQNFIAVRLGDVSGSYSQATEQKSLRSPRTSEISVPVRQGDQLTAALVLYGAKEIEGIDITVEFDPEILEAGDVTLKSGELEHENYQLIVNKDEPGRISLAVFAPTKNLFTGDGTIAYITFKVIGITWDSFIDVRRFLCNEVPVDDDGHDRIREPETVSGGFYMNEAVSMNLRLVFPEYNLMQDDLNGDGRIGVEDAVRGLREENVKTAVRVLRFLTH